MTPVLPQFDVGDVVSFTVPALLKQNAEPRELQGPIVKVLNGWVTVDVAGSEVVVPVEDCILVL